MRLPRVLIYAPFIVGGLFVLLLTSAIVKKELLRYSPIGFWESGVIVEAYRWSQGKPIYEDIETGHATLMYGPLMPVLVGEIFSITGPNNKIPPILNLTASLVLITLLSFVVGRFKGFVVGVFSWVVLFGLYNRTGLYYTVSRPDMISILFVCFSVFFLHKAVIGKKLGHYILGTGFLVVAFLFKQTAAVFSAYPLSYLLLASIADRRLPGKRELTLSMVPLAAILCTILYIKVAYPSVYLHMITIPAQFKIFPRRIPEFLFGLMYSTPVFVMVLMFRIRYACNSDVPRVVSLSLWVLLTIGVLTSTFFISKFGGDQNNWLPALFAMMVFSIVYADLALIDNNTSMRGDLRAFLSCCILAFLFCYSVAPPRGVYIFGHNDRVYISDHIGDLVLGLESTVTPKDVAYRRVIEYVSNQPGRIASPQDPTIPMYAKGQLGRNLGLEMDARLNIGIFANILPKSVETEILESDYVVTESNKRLELLLPVLERHEFVTETEIPPYRVWRNVHLQPPE